MTRWYSERKRDYYYREAKRQGYRARSAFKLLQIHKRYGVLKRGGIIIDLGASPGGWSQIAAKYARMVIAVDIQPMESMEGVVFVKGDITNDIDLKRVFNEEPEIIFHLAAFFANQIDIHLVGEDNNRM